MITSNKHEREKYHLYDMRLTRGITGSTITRNCGITYRSLRNWEKGITTPNIINANKLLQFYDYSFYNLDFTLYTAQENRINIQQKIDALAKEKPSLTYLLNPISLYDMRQHAGHSCATLAAICGVTNRSIRNWETGKSIPNIVHINDMLTICGYSFYSLDLTPFYRTIEERSK